MDKSALQLRAERAIASFSQSARKPIVIEFAGVPKAGKSSTIGYVQAFLKRCGLRIEVAVERASICPIRDKKHATFNIWTAATTLAQLLDKTQVPPRIDDPHILFLDRGIFDSICWIALLERLARIRPADQQVVEDFLRIPDWRKRITAVILMVTSPDHALKREQGLLPVHGSTGSIMNAEVLGQFRDISLDCAERLQREFRVFTIDTSAGETDDDPQRTAEVVAEIVISLLEEQAKEEVLCMPSDFAREVFGSRDFIAPEQVGALRSAFLTHGRYVPRQDIESNADYVQAIPIVVVRNASGAVLRLRRRESSPDKMLHEKTVIWAGGHVRKEDSDGSDTLITCAIRELDEELRLSIEPASLRLLGAIHQRSTPRTSKHVAIAYEWRARTDDVAIALASSEFFERRGNSVSGSFVPTRTLEADIAARRLTEGWSIALVRECLGEIEPTLFS